MGVSICTATLDEKSSAVHNLAEMAGAMGPAFMPSAPQSAFRVSGIGTRLPAAMGRFTKSVAECEGFFVACSLELQNHGSDVTIVSRISSHSTRGSYAI